ncbi:MAG: hypothetical protein LBF89_04855 [Bacteroidales bacterium]|nr:hypothetical protein [Bacteroidales bacterium]
MKSKILQVMICLALCESLAGRTVELNVAACDTIRYRFLYVINTAGNDTIAAFDSLSFDRKENSLYFNCEDEPTLRICIVTDRQSAVSESFTVFSQHTLFYVSLQDDMVNVSIENFQYPQNEENKSAYFVFLLIFFTVKWSISATYIFVMRLPKRLLSVAAGTFLLSAFIDWYLPVNYLFRLPILAFAECGLFLTAWKILPLKHNILMVSGANIAGFGLIILLYLLFIFW